jgi:beta-1,4-mannosyl-glycoprotein beta-1,4-N-acetylglucosaminyltransferase
MIVDVFPFFNELDLLDIRLHELWDVVDCFVLIEATRTYTGLSKPLYYDLVKERFANFNSHIMHIIVQDMPMTKDEINHSLSLGDRSWLESNYQVEDVWVRERHQRNQARGILLKEFDPEDILIIEDADEMVRASILKDIEKIICEGSNAVHQDLCSYYLNIRCTNMPWWGSKIIRNRFLNDHTVSEVRFHTKPRRFIEDGGWHYNFFGGAEKIFNKIKAYAHIEFDNPDVANIDNINARLKARTDVLGRLYEYEVIRLDWHNTPKYVMENLDKFDEYIYKE